tara:strand:+ start:6697 stop:7917 length:1221 start_codon:yes stop_codon:yes gene_type:complete
MTFCIVCGRSPVTGVLDLGSTSLANKFLRPEDVNDDEKSYPLRLGRCGSCGHVQLLEFVPPSAMFDDYLYISSMSDTLVQHLGRLAARVASWNALIQDDLVVDIGCNDGTLLAAFKEGGARVLGVDPAENLTPFAAERGVSVKTAYFGMAVAEEIVATQGRARAITATNVFPHIPVLDDFLRGISHLMADDGVFVIEAHYLADILEQVAFDTIYHEHVSYWSLTAMQALFSRFDLEVVDVERLPIHHGQLRVFVRHAGKGQVSATVAELRHFEDEAGITTAKALKDFAAATARIQGEMRAFMDTARKNGQTVAAYGAPAKGNTLLSYLKLGPGDVLWIADRSPLKQGRLSPGQHIPVVPTDCILKDMPDFMILLAWNFADEILEQQNEYRARGGKFVVPVPNVRVI